MTVAMSLVVKISCLN